MKLSRIQLAALKQNQKWREDRPTFLKLAKRYFLSKCIIPYLVLFGYSAFVGWGGWHIVSGIFAGVGFGYLLKDLTTINLTLKMWPLNLEIINWPKVNELVEKNEVTKQNET